MDDAALHRVLAVLDVHEQLVLGKPAVSACVAPHEADFRLDAFTFIINLALYKSFTISLFCSCDA